MGRNKIPKEQRELLYENKIKSDITGDYVKTLRIIVPVSMQQKQAIYKRAKELNISAADYLRSLAYKDIF